MDRVFLFPHEDVQRVAADIFRASGSPEAEAELVAQRLVKANLTGHDSHGVIRIPRYMGWVREGKLRPGQQADVVHDHGPMCLLKGYLGYGQVIATTAMELAIERARRHCVAAVGVTDLSHIGRLADFAVMAADADMIGVVVTCSGGFSKLVTPFGGSEALMSTNPIAAAFPSDRDFPVVLDLATSGWAEGKVRILVEAGLSTPEDVLLGPDGQPSTDPNDLYNGGCLRPLGGDQGYKGYLLNFMVEALAGLLTGGGFVGDGRPDPPFNNCSLMIVLDVTAFRPLHTFKDELERLIAYLKNCRPGHGGTVHYPGEIEAQRETRRRAQGIPLAETTVKYIQAEIDRLGVAADLLSLGTETKDPAWEY